MSVLTSIPTRIGLATLLVAIALALVATASASADQMGVEDGGVAGDYSFGAEGCGANIGKADPVGVLFRGRRAGVSNVQGYLETENHTDWDWTENSGLLADRQGLNVRENGAYVCHLTDAANAQYGPWSSRYHVRLWGIPSPNGGGGQLNTVGTPHHEDLIKHAGWGPISTPDHCNGAGVEIDGVKFSGNHAVDEGGIKQGKDSGFDQGRHMLREKFKNLHPTESEEWGNTVEFEQCDEDKAGSDGWGLIIWLNRGLRTDTRPAITSTVTTTGSTAYGHLETEESTTEYWFEYGLNPSQGAGGYPNKSAVKTVSGSADMDVSQELSGLTPNTLYYVRLFARNQDGEVEEGDEVQYSICGPIQDDDAVGPGPRSVARCDGDLDVFYRTPSGGLGHNWFTLGTGKWHQENLEGSVAPSSFPHPVMQLDDDLDVFYRTPSGGLGHNWWTLATGWHLENLEGAVASEPHAVVQPDGDLDVFYRTPSGGLGHNWFTLGTGKWHLENLEGSVASDPHPVMQVNGNLDVFYRTPSGGLGHNWFTLGTGKWHLENLEGSVASDPHAVVQPDGDLDVFYRTPSGGLGHNWWTLGTGWHQENLEGSVAPSAVPHPVVQPDGDLDVFYRTPSGGLGHNWFTLGTGKWHLENLEGAVASEPHAVAQPDGDLDVFYRTPSGGLGHNWFTLGTGKWHLENLEGSVASDPRAAAQVDGDLDVFYRTPSGGIGHNWFTLGTGKWNLENLEGSVGPTPPKATTQPVSGFADTEATLIGTVNPEGSATSYYFEYGKTTSYGTKKPATGESIGLGLENVAVAQTLSGLSPQTEYHYRVVAISPEGTTNGEDMTFETSATRMKLAGMRIIEPFNGSSESLANFSSKWSALGWAAGTTPKGEDTTSGWRPASAYSTINGAYYNSSLTDTGPGIAAAATMATNPGSTERYFSLWLDMQTPASTRAGYELRFTNTSSNTYTAKIYKWVGGVQTELASKTNYSFVNGNSLAIIDLGGTVSAWTDTGSGYGQLLSAADSAFSSGYAGLYGAGNTTRLTKFKAGVLNFPKATTEAAISVKATEATLNGTVNPEGSATTYQFEYGTTTSYGTKIPASPKEIGSGTSAVAVSQTPTGLSQGTTYHYRVVATNAAGTTNGEDKTVMTLKLPKATTEAAISVKATEATLNGTVNPEGSATTYQFEYGTTTSYGTKIPASPKEIGSGTSAVAVSQTPAGLSSSTTYHYRVVATNAAGTTNGEDKTVTTTLKLPKATTEAAISVKATEATLNGTVNPEGSATTYQFEYGTTTSYGTKIPASPKEIGSGTSAVAVSQTPTGLSQGTTYHYRVVATNAAGTTNGEDKTVTTTLKLPKATTEAAISVKATEATLNGTVNPEGSATTYEFEYGTTTSYGTKIPASPKEIGSGTSAVAVSQTPAGLSSSTTYHYRVVATNATGTTNGEDKTLTTLSGPIAAYSFDENSGTTVDDSVASHDGTISGAKWTASGKYGSALEFTAASKNVVTVPESEDLRFKNFTLEAWVSPSETRALAAIIAKTNPEDYGYALYAGGELAGKPEGLITNKKSVQSYAFYNSVLPLNTWTHLALTSDGTNLRLYANGTLVDTRSATSVQAGKGVLKIGGTEIFGGTEYFSGKIDEVRLYDRALSAAEVETDKNRRVETAAPPPGPIAAYSFDENSGTTVDDSVASHDGTISGAKWTASGKYGSALEFTAASKNVVTVPESEDLRFKNFTLEAWVSPSETRALAAIIAKTNPEDYGYALYAGGELAGKPEGLITNKKSVQSYAFYNSVLPLNTWTHLALTSDGTNLRLYANGTLVDTRSATSVQAGKGVLKIGGTEIFGGAEYFSGKIDEVRLYDRALSAAEVAADKDTRVQPLSGPIAAYSFDENSGTTVDDSVASHDGTISGAKWTASGKYGSALEFTAASKNVVTVPESEDLRFKNFTLEAWVSPSETRALAAIIAKTNPEDYGYALYAGGELAGKPEGLITNKKSVQSYAFYNSVLPLNTWTHLALTSDGTNLRLYANGTLVDTRSATSVQAGKGVLKIGGTEIFGGAEYFSGKIDEVRLYDRALSAAEVAADKDTRVQPL